MCLAGACVASTLVVLGLVLRLRQQLRLSLRPSKDASHAKRIELDDLCNFEAKLARPISPHGMHELAQQLSG